MGFTTFNIAAFEINSSWLYLRNVDDRKIENVDVGSTRFRDRSRDRSHGNLHNDGSTGSGIHSSRRNRYDDKSGRRKSYYKSERHHENEPAGSENGNKNEDNEDAPTSNEAPVWRPMLPFHPRPPPIFFPLRPMFPPRLMFPPRPIFFPPRQVISPMGMGYLPPPPPRPFMRFPPRLPAIYFPPRHLAPPPHLLIEKDFERKS